MYQLLWAFMLLASLTRIAVVTCENKQFPTFTWSFVFTKLVATVTGTKIGSLHIATLVLTDVVCQALINVCEEEQSKFI